MPSSLKQAVGLIVALVICYGAAGIGAMATYPGLTPWYAGLVKPSWTPPNWVFGPVWTLLYGMMAVAAWNVWRLEPTRLGRLPLLLFGSQLVLNTLWSVLFFGLRSPGLAAVDIMVLWGLIAATIGTFLRVSIPSGALLVPYLLWVSYAAALNIVIWRLNG
ncbi:TspO/MBR family protein [Planctomycetes bacterium Pan216]|uniref:TspO/MBR family protein n=1 Tax=Kolteria novifilia TaxID=2527975 RepID=A0A518B356_9BACT|nr:TspO/MBR family protein [Planctomycetes bacterium Pan216]